MNINKISVFCGSSAGNDSEIKNSAVDLGKLLAMNRISLVYGGGKIGLMGIIADAVLDAGGEVIGIIPEFLKQKELAHEKISELYVVNSMHERKELISKIADGFITLPGGLGTLDELFEIVTWAQLGLHKKPCGVLNVNGYFDFIRKFLNHSVKNEFVQKEFMDMIIFENDPQKLLDKFYIYRHPQIDKKLELIEKI